MILAFLIGIITAISSFMFNFLIENLIGVILKINNIFTGYYIFPILGGLILGIINKYIITGNRAFEIVAIEEEISNIENQLLSFKEVILKVISSIISLIFGFSLGKQGTIIYIGGFIGSFFGYNYKFSKSDIKTYIGCGVAGMVSGIFGLPILGITLVYEIILSEIKLKRILLISISSFTSYFIIFELTHHRMFLNAFIIVEDNFNFNILYIILFALGISFVSILYNLAINKLGSGILDKFSFLGPLFAGMIITIFGLKMNEVYILHSESFIALIKNQDTISYLIMYLLIKVLITGISYNFGGYGGVFLPGIIIGAIFGKIYFLYFGYLNLNYMIVLGIAGIFTGFSGALFSASILGFKLSGNNMEIILPLIIINGICFYVVKKSNVDFIYKKIKNKQ